MIRPLGRAGWLAVLVIASGCSRSEPPNPLPSLPPARARLQPAPVVTTNHPATILPAAAPLSAEQLEVDYLQAQDVAARVAVLDDLSDAEPFAALAVLSRLFFVEREPALQEEILNQLVYINGAEAAKIELLSEAVKPNQIAAVRQAAIEVMVDIDDPSAVQVLESLLKDSDPDVRAAAADAIAELQRGE